MPALQLEAVLDNLNGQAQVSSRPLPAALSLFSLPPSRRDRCSLPRIQQPSPLFARAYHPLTLRTSHVPTTSNARLQGSNASATGGKRLLKDALPPAPPTPPPGVLRASAASGKRPAPGRTPGACRLPYPPGLAPGVALPAVTSRLRLYRTSTMLSAIASLARSPGHPPRASARRRCQRGYRPCPNSSPSR